MNVFCVYIDLCQHVRVCVLRRGREDERVRMLGRVLLVSCLSNEQAKPFVQELSASSPAWEDIISTEGDSLWFSASSFRSIYQNSPVLLLNPMVWLEYRKERTRKSATNYRVVSCCEIESLIYKKNLTVKRLLASCSHCHYATTNLNLRWETAYSNGAWSRLLFHFIFTDHQNTMQKKISGSRNILVG